MCKILHACLMSTALLLGGCGGGSSSSDGGGAANAGGTQTGGASGNGGTSGGGSSIAGTYVGPATATVSGGGFSETFTETVQVVIGQDNSVTFGGAGGPSAGTAVVNGDTFTMNVPASFFNEPGFTCTGTLVVNGTINGDTITGTISSSGVTCNGVPFTLSGNFNLQKTGGGTQNRAGSGLFQELRSVLPTLVE